MGKGNNDGIELVIESIIVRGQRRKTGTGMAQARSPLVVKVKGDGHELLPGTRSGPGRRQIGVLLLPEGLPMPRVLKKIFAVETKEFIAQKRQGIGPGIPDEKLAVDPQNVF